MQEQNTPPGATGRWPDHCPPTPSQKVHRHGSTSPARRIQVQIDPAGRHRLEAIPGLAATARLAVLVGDPTQPGPYVIRVKVPSGVKLMPHQHPEDRVYTVMSGVFYVGLGETFDGDKVKAYPPGSVIVLPGDAAFPLGQIGRVRHAGDGQRAARA